MNTALTRRGLFGLAAVVSMAAAGCSSSSGTTQESSSNRAQVYASTIVWASIVQAVGGDRVEVTTPIMSPDQDPHDYEASAQDKLSMSQAGLAVLNGGGYDAWATALVESVDQPPVVVDAFVQGGHADGANEHVFYDLDTAKTVAGAIARELGVQDAANAQTYTKNAEAFITEIDALLQRARDWAAANGGAKVVSTESVAAYLLDDLGLTDVTPADFIRQSESESGPSVAVIEATRQLVGTEARVLVVNGQTEDAVSKRLVARATETGTKIVKVYETFPEGVDDYVTMIGNAVDALTA